MQTLFSAYSRLNSLNTHKSCCRKNQFMKSPVEHARIRIQIQKTNAIYQGSVDAAIKIAKSYGIKGLYKGYLATWIR